MTTHRLIISGILIAMLLACATAPAFAAFDWNSGAGITWAYGATGTNPPTPGKDIEKIGVGSDSNQYVFRMYLDSAPTTSDYGTIYGIYLGASSPPTDYSIESLLKKNTKGVLSYSYLLGDTSFNLATNGFSRLDNGKTLEWKIDKTDVTGDWNFLLGATANSSGETVYDHTNVAATPIPAAAWLLGSGIIGLIGIRRRNQKRLSVERSILG